MKKAAIPDFEEQRLQALKELDILDTDPDEGFDRLTRVIKAFFEVEIVLVSLVDKDRQWFKSRQGLDVSETSREVSFCAHAILGDDVFCIPDAAKDERFSDNPLVVGEPKIRFYAGTPLSVQGGLKVGTLCLIDDKPRTLNSDQFAALKDFGDCIEQQLVQSRLQNDAKFLVSQTSRLNTLLEAVADGIVTIDEEGNIESLNTEAAHIFGYEPYELTGHKFKNLMPDLGRGGWEGYLEIIFGEDRKEERDAINEVMGCRKDGSLFPMDLSVRVMHLEGQKLYTGIIRDITERKAVEDELQRGRKILEITKETLPLGLSVFDENMNLSVINQEASDLFGLPVELSQIGTPYREIMRYFALRGDYGPGDLDEILEERDRIGRSPKMERFIRSVDGGKRQIEVSTKPMPGGGGRFNISRYYRAFAK